MGRGKIEIKRIENSTNRQVTFSKRRGGLIKKAKEITTLCDAKVSVVIIDASGKMVDFCSPNTTVPEVLDKYQSLSSQKLWDEKHESLSNEIERVKKENGDLNIELRHLRGEDITSLPHQDLIQMEEALLNGLSAISARQMELFKMCEKKNKMVDEENHELACYLEKMQMGGSMRGGMENNGYPVSNDTSHQLMPPFGFKMNPDLHEERFM